MSVEAHPSKRTSLLAWFLFSPLTGLLGAAVLAKLWEWFVADTFGLIHLSVMQAFGLRWVVFLLTYQWHPSDADAQADVFTALALSIFASLLALGSGFVVVQFIG